MKFCRLGKERLINIEKFEMIKTSIFELLSFKDQSLVNLYKSSLKLLFNKVKDNNIELDWSSPVEITCLKEKHLIKNDNTVDTDVKDIVNYLVELDNNGEFQILDRPIFEVDI